MPQIDKQNWDILSDLIKKSQSIILITHINADGDGLGSEIAFYYYFKQLKKKCRIINPTPLPYNYSIIDPDNIVEVYDETMHKWIEGVDLVIVFDIGDHRRVGKIAEKVFCHTNTVSIDHHPANRDHPFALNIVDQNAPATGYLIWKYFQHIGFADHNLPIKIANALYASVVTDTGSFKYQSTTPDTHYMAAQLIKSGVNSYEIQKNIYEQRRISQVILLGKMIETLHYSNNRKIAWVIMTQKMIRDSNGTDEDVDGFTEFIRGINRVEISFMILEKKDGTHRINFRSSGIYTVNDVAKVFNGGGHKYAAGASIKDSSTKNIEKNIIKQLSKKIKGEFSGNKK